VGRRTADSGGLVLSSPPEGARPLF